MTDRIIELAGPAGAGKSSLLRALSRSDPRIRANVVIPRSRYVSDAVRLLPAFVRFHHPFKGVRTKEMKRVLHLTTLERMLSGSARPGQLHVLDEGPVYMLARLLFFGEDCLENDAFRRWWDSAVQRWAHLLHVIVWLDADTSILARRIQTRSGRPPVSDTSDAFLSQFLSRYRGCYVRVLKELGARGGPVVIAIDTGHAAKDQTVERVMSALEPYAS